MKYKGYEAVVDYDKKTGFLRGRVINAQDVIAFDGASIAELETAFYGIIDEYVVAVGVARDLED